jgi:uncharacterized protein (TIGR00369 family)
MMADREAEATLENARAFTARIPHARALGMTIDEVGDGVVGMSVPYDARLVGDPESGVIHGGVITTLLDTCCGAAVLSHPETGFSTATIDLRIDYMRRAETGMRIRARAECYRMTRYVAFVRALAYTDSLVAPVASAHGAFTVERGRQ